MKQEGICKNLHLESKTFVIELRGIIWAALKHSGTWWEESSNKEGTRQKVSVYPPSADNCNYEQPHGKPRVWSEGVNENININKTGL